MSDPTPAGMSWLDNFKSSAEKAATQAKQTLSEGATKMSSAIAASAQEYAPRRASGEDTRGGSAGAAAAAAETEPPASSSSGPAASSGPALEFVRLPVASAKKLRLLDKADVLALERAHAEERAALVAENDVARAVLRKHLADEKAIDEALRAEAEAMKEKDAAAEGTREAPEETSENDANDVAKSSDPRSGSDPVDALGAAFRTRAADEGTARVLLLASRAESEAHVIRAEAAESALASARSAMLDAEARLETMDTKVAALAAMRDDAEAREREAKESAAAAERKREEAERKREEAERKLDETFAKLEAAAKKKREKLAALEETSRTSGAPSGPEGGVRAPEEEEDGLPEEREASKDDGSKAEEGASEGTSEGASRGASQGASQGASEGASPQPADVSSSSAASSLRARLAESERRCAELERERKAAHEVARETGELADESAKFIADLKRKLQLASESASASDARRAESETLLHAARAELNAARKVLVDRDAQLKATARDATEKERSSDAARKASDRALAEASSKLAALELAASELRAETRGANHRAEEAERSLAAQTRRSAALDERLHAAEAALVEARDAASDAVERLTHAEERGADAELRAAEAEAKAEALRFEMDEEVERIRASAAERTRRPEDEDAASSNSERSEKRTRAPRGAGDGPIDDREGRGGGSAEEGASTAEGASDRPLGPPPLGSSAPSAAAGSGSGSSASLEQPRSSDVSNHPEETLSSANLSGENLSVAALTARLAETSRALAETRRALDAARLLARPGEDTAELSRLRASAMRGAEAERRVAGLERRLEEAEANAADARRRAKEAEDTAARNADDFAAWRERARAMMVDKDAELERARATGGARGGAGGMGAKEAGDGRAFDASGRGANANGPAAAGASSSRRGVVGSVTDGSPSLETLSYLRSVTLKFVEAPDWETQQRLLPVLGALLGWDAGEARRVAKAREAWEPPDVTLAKMAPEMPDGATVAGYGNAVTSTLGLGNLF